MRPLNLLVIARPDAPHLRILSTLPEGTKVTISNDPQELVETAPQADVLLNTTHFGELLRKVFVAASKVQWVHSLSAGVEYQLFPEMVQSSVPLTNGRGVYRESLGEFTIGAILFFAKDFRRLVRQQEAARWEQYDVDMIMGKTLGIVGYGELGRSAARRAKALDMKILATRRRHSEPGDGILDQAFPLDQRGDMIAQSDYVLVSAPLTAESRGIVGESEIARMKPEGVIINIGRGPLIDEAPLVRALQERRIRGAALDVFDTEPLPADHAFWKLDNVLLSPHSADHTCDWLDQSAQFFVGNFHRFVAGEPLKNLVDKQAGY